MTEQPDLLGWVKPVEPPFVRGSQTSEAAAKAIKKCTGALHIRILAYLAQHPEGGTDQEIQDALGMNPSTERPRRIELAAAGKIESFGCTRPSPSGRQCVVWHIVQGAL